MVSFLNFSADELTRTAVVAVAQRNTCAFTPVAFPFWRLFATSELLTDTPLLPMQAMPLNPVADASLSTMVLKSTIPVTDERLTPPVLAVEGGTCQRG